MSYCVIPLSNFIEYTGQILPQLLIGTVETIKIFFITLIIALPLGFIVSMGSRTRFTPLRVLTKTYIWIFRGTPLMLQLFFVYFFLPYVGITLPPFESAVVAFVINYAAYFAEIYRSGIESIDLGQYEAAKALGFKQAPTMLYIIFPQTIRRIIPPVSNEVITLIKDTALVNVISVSELLKAAKSAVNRDTNPTAYLIAAGVYLLLTFLLTMLSGWLEKKASYYEANTSEKKQKRFSFLNRLGS